MTEKEHKDVYIACAVGGVGLILVLLYLFGGASSVAPASDTGATLPTVASVAPPGQGDYNYNIAPYNPDPPITNALPGYQASSLPDNGGGCCDNCGPQTGSQYNLPNVAQFQTLIGTGAG